MSETETTTLPAGAYAIVECLGHRTLIGRISEIERFGVKLLSIEPIYQGALLAPVLIGGGSIYAFTECSAETAAKRGATKSWELPTSLRATLPAPALPAPTEDPDDVRHYDRSNDRGEDPR